MIELEQLIQAVGLVVGSVVQNIGKKRKECQRQTNLAITLVEDHQMSLPTRGYMTNNRIPRPINTYPFNHELVDRLLTNCAKCMQAIILSPKEFDHLQIRFCNAAREAGMNKGKCGLKYLLFVLLFFNRSKMKYSDLEITFGGGKSSYCDRLKPAARVLLDIFQADLNDLWPNEEELIFLRRFSPSWLRGMSVIGCWDSTKIRSGGFTSEHYDPHKFHGLKYSIMTDIFGNVIYIMCANGSGADNIQRCESDVYLQLNNKILGPYDTFLTDSSYAGLSHIYGQASIVKQFTNHQIALMPLEFREDARKFGRTISSIKASTENNNSGMKRGQFNSNSNTIRMSCNNQHGEHDIALFSELGLY